MGENFALETEWIISVKKCFLEGSSSIANIVLDLSDYELILMSHSPIYPLDDEYTKISDRTGWYSTWVITSESSSIWGGFKSTILYARTLFSKFQRFILRSSEERKHSPSGATLSELIL